MLTALINLVSAVLFLAGGLMALAAFTLIINFIQRGI
jgi:hypothetical protein